MKFTSAKDTQTKAEEVKNPLWVITIGMAVFFAAVGAILAFD